MTALRRATATASLPPDTDGSVVVANLDTSAIHRMDRVGAAIWLAIADDRSPSGIAAEAAVSLGIDADPAFRGAVSEFLDHLVGLGLVEPAPGRAGRHAGGRPGGTPG